MTDREIALKYAPHLYFDKNEPFTIDQIGYSLFRSSGSSPSFNRDIRIEDKTTDFVVEYQLYYDYDIQHMYDLEHFWVYVDYDGKVMNGEASAHGSYLNCYQYKKILEEDTHIPVYVQPGKHALLPEGDLFRLFSDYKEVCNVLAGVDGLLAADLFKGMIRKDSYIDYKVCSYIREHYSFEPSLCFYPVNYEEDLIVTWEELYRLIPERVNKLLKSLGL